MVRRFDPFTYEGEERHATPTVFRRSPCFRARPSTSQSRWCWCICFWAWPVQSSTS